MPQLVGKIFASAGCGKTTALLDRLDKVFSDGVRATNVLFSTFTRSGAYEARDRAMTKFGFGEDEFPYFRTLHSICFRAIVSPKIMSRMDYITLGRALHVRFGSAGLGEELYERGKGDALLALYDLQRNLCSEENLIPEEYGIRVSKQDYEHFIQTYEKYKGHRGLYDYTDLISEVVHEEIRLPVKVAFIDEAQDLTPLQAQVVNILAANAQEVWYAGDDDQCIFSYSGADPRILVDMEATERVVLEKSYRLPVSVANLANTIVHQIKYREPKTIRSAKEHAGSVRRSNNFLDDLLPDESTTILCRNRVFFGYFEEYLRQKGYLYSFVKATTAEEVLDPNDMVQIRRAVLTWKKMLHSGDLKFPASQIKVLAQFIPKVLWRLKDRRFLKQLDDEPLSYNDLINKHNLLAQDIWQNSLSDIPWDLKQYIQLLDEQNKLEDKPHIQIGTIHSFKGKEDDHIIILPDMSWQTWQGWQDKPEREHRVFYVGVTRAKEKLTLLNPLTRFSYPWPAHS